MKPGLATKLASTQAPSAVVRIRLMVGAVVALTGCASSKPEAMGNLNRELNPESFYLPKDEAARVVTVTTNGTATADVLVQTRRVAVKEGGPKETVERFGEIYAFSPSFFAVHRDEPTKIPRGLAARTQIGDGSRRGAVLAGYGAAQVLPGPPFTFAGYLGTAIPAGPNVRVGGLWCLLAIFLPAWRLIAGGLPFWHQLRSCRHSMRRWAWRPWGGVD